MNTIQPFYRFKAEAGDEPSSAELLIFDVIGNWEDIGEVGAKAFARDLGALPKSVKRLDIHINSPGGSVSEAMAIYSRLADHQSNKNIYVDGIAASAATLVAMVGHKIFIRANATMMIHLPMALAIGNADDMRTTIAALDSVTESMLNLYAKRTKTEREAIRGLMAAETWMSAQDAVDKGFADEVRGVVKAAAIVGEKKAMFNGVTFDLSRFHNVPAFTGQTTERQTMPTKPNAETTPPADGEPKPPAAPEGQATEDPPKPPTQPTPPPPPAAAAAAAPTNDFDKGIAAERARIAALQKYDKPATHALIVKAIADGKTVADITDELFAALEKGGQQQARRNDASQLDHVPPSNPDGTEGDASAEFGNRLKTAVTNRLKASGKKSPLLNGRN